MLFRIVSGARPNRAGFVDLLRRAGASDVWLTRYDGEHGILRCVRGGEQRAIDLLTVQLKAHGLAIETLSTSGTIAALERGHPRLDLPSGRA